MFNMQHTAKIISSARKARNMTQLELADQLGVSFQAVSNWERGISMPDIAKLPDVARLLSVSIDELLGESSSLVNGLLSEEGDAYLENAQISPQELETAAPVLKPDQFKTAFEHTDPPIEFSGDLSELSSLLPYLDEETMDGLAQAAYEKHGICALSSVAPFISSGRIDAIAQQEYEKNGIDHVAPIAPFLSQNVIDELAQKTYERDGISTLSSVAPFMSSGYIDAIAQQEYEKNGIDHVASIAPFLSQRTLDSIAKKVLLRIRGFLQLHLLPPLSVKT